jgi:antitoxin MazE
MVDPDLSGAYLLCRYALEYQMEARIQRWGNSLAVRIPKAFAAEVGLREDGPVEMTVREGSLVIVPAAPPKRRLADLLAAVTPENVHSEVAMGEPRGNEAW